MAPIKRVVYFGIFRVWVSASNSMIPIGPKVQKEKFWKWSDGDQKHSFQAYSWWWWRDWERFLFALKLGFDITFPTQVNELLVEFQDITSIDLPRELPPLTNIQHVIDLVPRSQLPKLQYYRLNSKESWNK